MKGIVFFDLDGTLLNKESTLSEENRQAMKSLKENGYEPMVASGRSPKEIEELMEGTVVDSYVSLNGQYTVFQGKTVATHPISSEKIDKLTQLADKFQHGISFYSQNDYQINYLTDAAIKLYEYDHAPLPKVNPTYYQEAPIYMCYLFSEEPEKDEIYQKELDKEFTFFRDSPFSVAFVELGVSKKVGIEEIISQIGQTNLKTVGFGDGMNDLGIFEAVDISVAMGNANDLVKSHADIVTSANDEDGIIRGLKQLKLI